MSGKFERVGDVVAKFEPCVNCDNGWVTSVNPYTSTSPVPTGGQVVTRCACWIAHQRKVLDALQAKSKSRRTRKTDR